MTITRIKFSTGFFPICAFNAFHFLGFESFYSNKINLENGMKKNPSCNYFLNETKSIQKEPFIYEIMFQNAVKRRFYTLVQHNFIATGVHLEYTIIVDSVMQQQKETLNSW